MSSDTTRRALLAGGVATAVGGGDVLPLVRPAPASASSYRDAELLSLREPYERTLAEMEAMSAPHSRAEDVYFDLKASNPELDRRLLRKRSGLSLAERAYVRALRRNGAVIAKIIAAPAFSLAGATFKARVSYRESNLNTDLVDSIVNDLLEMEA